MDAITRKVTTRGEAILAIVDACAFLGWHVATEDGDLEKEADGLVIGKREFVAKWAIGEAPVGPTKT